MGTVAALVAAALPPASVLAQPAVARGTATKIGLQKTSHGSILVDARGYTLYGFTKDTRNHDACTAIFYCIHEWPAVTTTGTAVAGRGVRGSLLGTIKFKGTHRQVTYAGHPLYTYVQDSRPAQTSNINILQFQGRWPAVNAAGRLVK
jgi:predicted lipoprotein with Yx(FWY)xxD motif